MNLTDVINESMKEQTETAVCNDLVQAAVDQIASQRKERVVNVLACTIERKAASLKEAVETLKRVREMEKAQTALVKKINRAFRYFQVTGIPFPLFLALNAGAKRLDRDTNSFCSQVGIPTPNAESPLWEVPSDFVIPEN